MKKMKMKLNKLSKFKNRFILLSLLMLIGGAAIAAKPKMQVAVSFSILADIVQNVGGDKITVNSVVGFGYEVHDYVVKPSDLIKLHHSKILFINGYNLETGWIKTVTSIYKGEVVSVANGLINPVYINKLIDPHAWGSPVIVANTYVPNIIQGLCNVDPLNCKYYRINGAKYVVKLKKLDSWVKVKLSVIPQLNRQAIITHDALNYYARQYNIKFFPVYGVANEDTSAKNIIALEKLIKTNNIRVLFLENLSGNKIMRIIATDAKVKIGGKLYADSLVQPEFSQNKHLIADTYINMVQLNTNTLLAAWR